MSYEITLNDWEPPASDTAWDRVRLEFSQTGNPIGTDWQPDDPQSIAIDPTPEDPDPIDITTLNFPWLEGYVRAVFLHPDDSESLPSSPLYTMIVWNGGLRGMVPRAGRALQGFNVTLTDDQIAAALADAVAEVIFYAPGWGKTLVATSRNAANVPTEFEVTPELTFPEQTVVIAQTALNHFFYLAEGGKIQEAITNEATSWSWQKSASVVADRWKALVKARDEALAVLLRSDDQAFETYVSFIAVRDACASAVIEPWVDTALVGIGQVDYRFLSP